MLWDPSTGGLQQTLQSHSHSDWVKSVAFSPDGQLLASNTTEKIMLWDPSTGELQQTLQSHSHSDWIWSVAFSPDGQLLVSRAINKIMLWDPSTGDLLQTFEGHSHWVWSETNVGIFILDNAWIYFRGRRVLWLPLHYRPTCLAFKAGILALGHSSTRVSFISRFA